MEIEMNNGALARWLTLSLAILGLATALFGAGYNYRSLESVRADLQPRVEKIEKEGSPQLSLVGKDIEFIKKALERNDEEHRQIMQKLDEIQKDLVKHMVRDK